MFLGTKVRRDLDPKHNSFIQIVMYSYWVYIDRREKSVAFVCTVIVRLDLLARHAKIVKKRKKGS